MKEEILKIKAALTEAIQNRAASTANDLYDDSCVMFLLAPPLQEKKLSGMDGINDLETWFATFEGNIGLESEDMVIFCDNNIAYLHSLEHLTGHRTDGSDTNRK